MALQTITNPTLVVAKNLMHLLCDDIDENIFADRLGTTINHPAYVLGHTAYYAGVCIEFLGGSVTFGEDEEKLYQIGAECLDDASLYPNKSHCVNHFDSRCQAASDFINSSDLSFRRTYTICKTFRHTWGSCYVYAYRTPLLPSRSN